MILNLKKKFFQKQSLPTERIPPERVLKNYLNTTPEGERGLNLGCGPFPLKGWMNVDIARPEHVDIMWDLRQKLPFIPDNTFDFVYHEHFMEHIDRKSAFELACECLRVLKPGGRIRIAMPDLDNVIKNYIEDAKFSDAKWYGDFKDYYGQFFYTRGEVFDICVRGWGHTYLYNYEDLELLLKAAGFKDIERVDLNKSRVPFLCNRERRPITESSLTAEGSKA